MEEPVAPWRCCLVQALAVMVAPCRLRPVLDLLVVVAWHCFLAPALAVLVVRCRLRLVLALLLVVT